VMLFMILPAATFASADEKVRDANSAIQIGRRICRLEAKGTGGWHAILHKGEAAWHVWFGNEAADSPCSFSGAIVQSDGSYTSCAVSACQVLKRPK
jgi:hypothetical protein